jgi:chemotaxis protein CheD
MAFEEERRNNGRDLEGLLIRPGELAVVEDGTMLMTIVSVGVAVCLWEPSRKVAGLAHFLQPSTSDRSKATPRFGNVAVPHLIALLRQWTPGVNCEAQIYGGAEHESCQGVGERNVAMAEKILNGLGILVVSRDVGGTKGRKLVFDSRLGHVAVVKVHTLRDSDWAA